jgi:hypothetical protein
VCAGNLVKGFGGAAGVREQQRIKDAIHGLARIEFDGPAELNFRGRRIPVVAKGEKAERGMSFRLLGIKADRLDGVGVGSFVKGFTAGRRMFSGDHVGAA